MNATDIIHYAPYYGHKSNVTMCGSRSPRFGWYPSSYITCPLCKDTNQFKADEALLHIVYDGNEDDYSHYVVRPRSLDNWEG